MRLIHWHDRERLGITFKQIESPFFAASDVRSAFEGRSFSTISGLDVLTFGRAWGQQEILDDLKNVLQEIEALHQRAFLKDGHLRSPEFFSERKRLLAQLDTHLTSFVRKGTGLPDHPNLKSALGISSRSLVHRWTQAGTPGQIPGYATHIKGISRAAKAMKYGGWIGMVVGAGASALKVQNVCSAGNKEACEKVKYTETGSYIGTVAGGAAAGAFLTGSVVSALCVALGVPTVGAATLACGIVVVGAGSFAGGTVVGTASEKFGEVIYEKTK
ncbi:MULTISPECIES: hypothetical protein [unclassified Pseudomonas]|uniref:hypothetical protein n=1 Tax=unclassified Pseudomonas TaxID=196821 RepID=UPI0030D70019